MAIGEFEEVGNVVRQFAADDATVVVGTAIDESLEGELHVTVVATGLGQQAQSQKTSIRAVGANRATGTGGPAGYSGVTSNSGKAPYVPATPPNYGGSPTSSYQKPVGVERKSAAGTARNSGIPASSEAGEQQDYLDIPAFLRRQAD